MIHKPSDKEQQYFIAQEMKRLKALHQQYAEKTAESERQRLKDLHYMHCTKCGQKMETTTLADIEVEVCPGCGGIYLDAGELNKIVDEQTRGPFGKALAYARKVFLSEE